MTVDPLDGDGYPAFYEQANAASLLAQRQFLWALRIRLAGMLAASIGGAVFLSLDMDAVGGWIALVGFLAAIVAEAYSSAEKPDKAWYEGRAAAESIKTLTWRYAMRGESFTGATDANSDSDFVGRLREVLQDLNDVDLSVPASGSEQITPAMRSIRQSSFETRKSMYRTGRIESQREWYKSKSIANGQAARLWTVCVFALEGLGVLGAVLIIVGISGVDLMALFAAIAATITAWVQAKQHKILATAYSVTSQELAAVKSELDLIIDESAWAAFVSQAEEAISREHTLWRASRGVRL